MPIVRAALMMVVCQLSACAFNVIYLRRSPTHFEARGSPAPALMLCADSSVELPMGLASPLRHGTIWHVVGTVPEGDVLATGDQVLTIAASDEYEAEPVVNNGGIVGFYLPTTVEFAPAAQAVTVNLRPDGTCPSA
jgi:hypothetical protein